MTAAITGIFHSLLLRLIVIMAILGCFTASVIVVSWSVFQSFDDEMAVLSSQRLPELRASSGVSRSADKTRALLANALAASDADSLAEAKSRATDVFNEFDQALSELPTRSREAMQPKLSAAETAVQDLLSARSTEFAEIASIQSTIKQASSDAQDASAAIEEANDSAFFEMTMSGEETVSATDERLTALLENDVGHFQVLLSMRGEVNLLTGLALSNARGQLVSIIDDLSTSSLARLELLVDENADDPFLQDVIPVIREALSTYRLAFDRNKSTPLSSQILATRLAVDKVLTPALDDVNFNLIIEADDTKSAIQESLYNLLNEEVEGMRRNAALDAATKEYFAILLQVAAAETDAELALSDQELSARGTELRELKSGTQFEEHPSLIRLLEFANPSSGLAAQRSAVLSARARAVSAAIEATQSVDAIAIDTSEFAATAKKQIDAAAVVLDGKIDGAKSTMTNISYAALCFLTLSAVLLWALASRPIARVTAVTERLAAGDLSEITGLKANAGELGRMAAALHVFRENALKNIQLQEDERERERAALEAERRAEHQKREDEKRRASEQAELEAAERAREKRLAAEEAERRLLEDERTKKQIDEQERIVGALAEGLRSLADGDLTHQISIDFPASYLALKEDFNSAVETLAAIVSRLADSTQTMEEGCAEIATASDDLATRTENNASTLEESVTAIDELSNSVSDAAKNADAANLSINAARGKTGANREVMRKAKSAMDQVEGSSNKITSIVGIIESIAFQTNLLALNAGVEAARAGDAGQGFAVVANEVRVLAQRCSEAANEIGAVVEESASTVQEGVELTEQANKAMADINDDIERIASIVAEIAQASSHQASGLESINQAIQDLDKSTQQNAAMFEETTASNRMLASEAQTLSSLVRKFKLSGQADHIEPDTIRAAS